MKNKFDISNYFSDVEIIRILCKKRALVAKKLHDDHFLRNISSGANSPHKFSSSDFNKMFPPRSKWIRLNLKERNIRNENAIKINTIQLERTILRERKRLKKGGVPPQWLIDLNSFIADIQISALSVSTPYIIQSPKIIPVLKDKVKREFRPISSFPLKDLIIIGQYSRYLTNCFDQLFFDCSYAFRSGINNPKSFNHHEAISDIISFKSRHKNVFVAECDIKKFYDCVNHSVIEKKFASFIEEAKLKLSIEIDQRAIILFDSYLKCFSFNHDVKLKENSLVKLGESIPWVDPLEFSSVGSDINSDRIGIPQGGALSCLIANILLHSVDAEIMKHKDDFMFYGRFCDDMVLMATDKAKCEYLFQIYQDGLKNVKLISHKPKNTGVYDSAFWDKSLKSKSPYAWAKPNLAQRNQISPWLSFVGYQVRYDGVVRIRKTSIEKELKKQVSETDKILKVLRKSRSAKVNEKAIIFRLQQRLISMAVGRMQMGSKKLSMCWAAGFKIAKGPLSIKSQFKRLDNNRERQIERAKRYVRRIQTPLSISAKPVKRQRYYGSKYSYHEQFI